VQRCGFGGRAVTVRVADGEPGSECQIDFAKLGLVFDPEVGRRRTAYVLIFTAVFSRHMFAWLTFAQTTAAVIAGCEAAWRFFGGVFKVLIPDNMPAIVSQPDRLNPVFTAGWLDYAQARGFVTDPARVRSPQDKPGVEAIVKYVRGNFWAGESFADLLDANGRVQAWCRQVAGQRVHGTTGARPAEVFAEQEAGLLLAGEGPYDIPAFGQAKVRRDHHVSFGKALYSVPTAYIGARVDLRADSALVRIYCRGQLIKTHPRQRPGGRVTDPVDLPEGTSEYALRDVAGLVAKAESHGAAVGVYAARILDGALPWTRMRAVYQLIGLAKRYGPDPVNSACQRALDLDVVNVTKIRRMLEHATENTPALPAAAAGEQDPAAAAAGKVIAARFARDPAEFAAGRPAQLRLGHRPHQRGHRRRAGGALVNATSGAGGKRVGVGCGRGRRPGQRGSEEDPPRAQARPDARHPARTARAGQAATPAACGLPRVDPRR
jgi:hypothetical protein